MIEFKTAEEMPFSVYDGTDYFINAIKDQDTEKIKEIEYEYQTSYLRIREIAFKESILKSDKEVIIRYIKSLKFIELEYLQPYLFELGQSFFEWTKNVLIK